jgi:predicted CoA-binding protein
MPVTPQTTPAAQPKAQDTPITLVLGATENADRYAFKAAHRLLAHGFGVHLVGRKAGAIHGHAIHTDLAQTPAIDTVTLYLNPDNQKPYYDAIIGLRPRRIIFNPGTENPELEQLARAHGIQPIEACTLVMLSTGQY